MASQYHPEFKSRPEQPAPLFREFIAAALARAQGHDEGASAPAEADASAEQPASPGAAGR